MQSKITNEIPLLPDKALIENGDGLINFEEFFIGLEELSFNPVSYSAKTNYDTYSQ